MSEQGSTAGAAPVSSRRMARRLLAGAGAADITAYRHAGGQPLAVMHALDEDGRVIIAACPSADHPLSDALDGEVVEVRLDVTLEAAEPSLRVTSATAHLLGLLTWLDADETALVLAGETAGCHCPITGEDPLDGLGSLAGEPGGRLGVITAERVMVHDAMGVSGHTLAEVVAADSAPSLLWNDLDSASAQEEVRELGDAALTLVCESVVKGRLPGVLCSHRPADGLCPSLHGRVVCADVAPDGVTLMHVSPTCVETVQVWLPSGTRRACEVGPFLRGCVQEALLEDLLRG
ncbi:MULTISPECIES: hypothetical protein [Actinomyces]|nr:MULTISPECIES: hypothetical protein [Actinomyces]